MAEFIDTDIPYALEQRVVTRAKIPVLGWKEIVTRSYAQVSFQKRPDGSWSQTFVQCAIEGDGGQVSFPAAFIRSIPPKTSTFTLENGVYKTDTGVGFIGVSGPVPTLPTEIDDPVVVDADGDGHPGVTVHLKLPLFGRIELYMVQANHALLNGTLENGELIGQATMRRLETRTLGASVSLFVANPPVHIVPNASTFRIVQDPDRQCRSRFSDGDREKP